MNFSDFFKHSQEPVRAAAQQLTKYQAMLDAGQITRPEYDDLCADVTDLAKIDHLAANITDRQEIQTAFKMLMTIASAIKG